MKRGGPLRRRTGLASVTPLPRGGRLPPRSERRTAEAPERRAIVVAVIARAGGRCEIAAPGCWGTATCVHERWKRSRFPGSHLHMAVCVATCAPCNSYVEDWPEWAEREGWSVPSGTPYPDDVDPGG